MNKVICDVCGTDYPETALQCPICGCARADGAQTSAGNTVPGEEESTGYTYVKGGRFSKSNVRKRLKANQIQESKIPEPEYDDDDEDDEDEEEEVASSNWGLITIVILLLLAIIAVSSYIAIVHFDLLGSKDPTETTGSIQSSTSASDNTSEGVRIPCTNVSLTDSEITLETLDSAWKLIVNVEPADTTDVPVFTSSNESVAVVDKNGLVTAVGNGEATITVTCGDVVTECKVICNLENGTVDPTDSADPTQPVDPDNTVVLELNRTDFTLSSKGASWNVYNGELDPADITWTSDNEKVVTVENGKVTAVGPGRTRVHAEYQGQKASCWVSCSFPAEEPTEPTEPNDEPAEVYAIRVNNLKPNYPTGDNSCEVSIEVDGSITLTIENSMGARMDVEWTMSSEGICSVEGTKVTGLAKGNVTLTATYDGQTFKCKVFVNVKPENNQ